MLSVTGLGMVVTFILVSMLPVALPDMSADLGATALQSDWFVLAYLLTTAALILVFGKVADVVGRRPVYLTGLALLTVGAAGILVASDPGPIIALRVVQGIGAAAVITNTTALLVEAFPPQRLAVGIGFNIAIMSSAVAIGPLLGGILTETVGWRGVFAVVVPLGAAGTIWAAVTLRRPLPTPAPRKRFDVLGAMLSAVILAALVYGVNRAGSVGFTDPSALVPLVAVPVLLVVFWRWERRVEAPVVEPSFLTDRFRGAAYGTTFLVTLAEGGVAVLMSLYLQSVRGTGPVGAGLQITALAVGTTLLSPVAGRLATRIPARMLATTATLCTGGALVVLTLHIAGPARAVPMVVILFALGAFGGLFKTANAAAINVGVTADRAGMANGLRVAFDNTAVTIATAMALAIAVSGLAVGLRDAVYAGSATVLSEAENAALVDGFATATAVMAVLALCAAIPSYLRGTRPDEPATMRATTIEERS